jgi:hypothetical protein
MTTKLSRRTAIASLALTAAATALPARALGTGEDPELLALGAELEGVIGEWKKQTVLDREERALWEAACERAGLPRVDFEDKGTMTTDEWHAYMYKRLAIRAPNHIEDPCNDDGESIAWNDLHSRMWPLIEDILEHRPRTVAGLVIMARAMSLECSSTWNSTSDPTAVNEQAFIEAVCNFCGVVPVPDEVTPSCQRVARMAVERRLAAIIQQQSEEIEQLRAELATPPWSRCAHWHGEWRATAARDFG